MRHVKLALAAAPVMLGLIAGQAHAQLVITPTFDSSFTSDPNGAAAEATINSAISVYEHDFTNPINVTIYFTETPNGLGGSAFSPLNVSYNDYRTALVNTKGADDAIVLANLPASGNPVPGYANADVETESAQLRAIGLAGAPQIGVGGTNYDSEIFLNTSLMNYSRTGPQDPNKYDISSVVSHEIDEALGLSSGLDHYNDSPPDVPTAVGSEDFFRFSAPGVRSYTNDPNAVSYFSEDGGVTPVAYFNQQHGGDYQDWASSGEPLSGPPRVQDAFGSPGVDSDLGPAEIKALEDIGYNFAPAAVPEASNTVSFGLLLALGIGGLVVAAKRKKAANAAA